MCATPDVIMRAYGEKLEAQRNMATEKEIKLAFFNSGYGPTKVKKWWEQYRLLNIIQPVTQKGFPLTNQRGEALYTSVFWPEPLLVVE